LHDYTPALNGAVSWLGERYLLAEPVRRRNWPALRRHVAGINPVKHPGGLRPPG
jgi:hypothetical protein